jgi:ubiquinone/menaquinone biosynthesis C-methylase UbiE
MNITLERTIRYRIKKCRAELSEFGFQKSVRVLEVGSGTGEEVLWCITSGSYCTAVEISAENCRIIIEKLRQKNKRTHADIIRAEAEHLPFREGLFDVVFCKSVLHHIGEPLQAIFEMHRVARVQGVVAAIEEPNALNIFWHIARITLQSKRFRKLVFPFFSAYYWEWDPDQHPFEDWATPFYPWQLHHFFKKANFQQIKVRTLWWPFYTERKWFWKAYLMSEKAIEKTWIVPYLLGQLFVVGRK